MVVRPGDQWLGLVYAVLNRNGNFPRRGGGCRVSLMGRDDSSVEERKRKLEKYFGVLSEEEAEEIWREIKERRKRCA